VEDDTNIDNSEEISVEDDSTIVTTESIDNDSTTVDDIIETEE
jgi:hypothetical protein